MESYPELNTQTVTGSDVPGSSESLSASQPLEHATGKPKDISKQVQTDSLVEYLRERVRKLEAEADAAREEAKTARKANDAAQKDAADARKAASDLQQKLNSPCPKYATVQQISEQTAPSGICNLQDSSASPAVSAPSPPAVSSMTSIATQAKAVESPSSLEPQPTSPSLAAPGVASADKEGASHSVESSHDMVTESSSRPTITSYTSRKRDAISLKRTNSGVKKRSSRPGVSKLGLRVAAVCSIHTTRSQKFEEATDVEMTDEPSQVPMQGAQLFTQGTDPACGRLSQKSQHWLGRLDKWRRVREKREET